MTAVVHRLENIGKVRRMAISGPPAPAAAMAAAGEEELGWDLADAVDEADAICNVPSREARQEMIKAVRATFDRIHVLSSMDEELKKLLIKEFRVVTKAHGEAVATKGEPSTRFYIVHRYHHRRGANIPNASKCTHAMLLCCALFECARAKLKSQSAAQPQTTSQLTQCSLCEYAPWPIVLACLGGAVWPEHALRATPSWRSLHEGVCGILRPSDLAPFGSCALGILRPSDLAPFRSCTLQILHPSDLAPFGSCSLRPSFGLPASRCWTHSALSGRWPYRMAPRIRVRLGPASVLVANIHHCAPVSAEAHCWSPPTADAPCCHRRGHRRRRPTSAH